jgi:hypothetical protein
MISASVIEACQGIGLRSASHSLISRSWKPRRSASAEAPPTISKARDNMPTPKESCCNVLP